MKHLLIVVAVMILGSAYASDGSEGSIRLEKVSIDGRLAIVEMSERGKINEIVKYVEASEMASDKYELRFGSESNYLEGDAINMLRVISYRAIGTANSLVEISVSNERSSYWRLRHVLETLQYNGLSPHQIRINIVEPNPNTDRVLTLHMKSRPVSYAQVTNTVPDDLIAGY